MAKLVNEAVGLAAVSTGSPGKYKIRLIDAGIGSSGVYPAATLQQAAADRIFPKGTRVHLDHPFNQSEMSGPRSVKDWCAVLDEDATYNSEQESLESSIRVFKPYQQLIEEMKDEVGMSIIAFAETSPANALGDRPAAAAACSTFCPCSSVPVRKNTSAPSRRRKRAITSAAIDV